MPDDSSFRRRLVLTTSKAGLSCTLTVLPGLADDLPTDLEIMALLEEHRLSTSTVDIDAVNSLVALAKTEPDGEHHAVIATGRAAEDGVHASFSLDASLENAFREIARRRELMETLDENPPAQDAQVAEDGDTIDYRDQSAFVIVRRGDRLGTVTDPTPGSDGINVRGEVIRPKGGRSLTLSLDESTTIEGNRLIAATDGRLVHGIDAVRVESTLTIPNDVDYTTGNIDFPGDVVIRGSIKDNFVVHACRDLQAESPVEAAMICVARDARLGRGMAGRGHGRLTVGRDLYAHYLDGVDACVGRECVVENEIKECSLAVNGALRSLSCAFYGGTLIAASPVELGIVGSPGGAETAIEIGAIADLERLAGRIERMLKALETETRQSADELDALNAIVRKLTPQQAERLTELQFTQIRAEELAGKIANAAKQLLESINTLPTPCLTVGRTLHKGVRIRLRHVELQIKGAVECPLTLDLSPTGEPRCFLNGATEPTPIGSIATRLDSDGPNPLEMLTEIAERAVSKLNDAA